MKRRHRLLLILVPVLAVLAGAAVWWALTPREPAYGGKSLLRWIAEIKAGPSANPPRFAPSPAEAEAVKAMGLNAIPGLLESVRDRDYEPWWSATYRHCYLHLPPGLSGVLPAPARLNPEGEWVFRCFVAERCNGLWPQTKPLLLSTLRHPRSEVRSTAIWALSWQTNLPAEVFQALTNRLQDSDGEVRMYVHAAIAHYGAAASNALPAIVDNLLSRNRPAGFNPSERERAAGADALGRMGPAAAAAVPVLQAGAAQRTSSYYRISSAIALWRIRHHAPDALPVLIEDFEKVPDVMPMILACLGEMGPEAAEAVPRIVRFLDSTPDPNVFGFGAVLNRQVALEALRKIAPDVAAKWEREGENKEP